MDITQTLLEAVDRAGFRLTEARRAVATLVASREGHFTAADLVSDARDRRIGVGRATIFRSLDLFAQLDLLERLDLPSGDHAYVPCEPVHHHHVVCSRCGRATDVEDHGLQSIVDELARRTGYAIDSHRLELFGLCPDCRRAGP